MILQNGVALVDLMATILAGINKDEVIQYVLAMLDDLLTYIVAIFWGMAQT